MCSDVRLRLEGETKVEKTVEKCLLVKNWAYAGQFRKCRGLKGRVSYLYPGVLFYVYQFVIGATPTFTCLLQDAFFYQIFNIP